MSDRISSEVKLRVYQALPPERLTRLANTFGLGRNARSPSELADVMAQAADGVILTFINSHLDFLELKELRDIAKKLGVGKGIPDYETLASEVEQFIRTGRSAPSAVALSGDAGVTFEHLWEEADRLAQPTVHLQLIDRPKKSQPRAAIWSETELEINGRQHWLTVDLRQHPDESLRADGILEVFANWGDQHGFATFSKARLPKAREGQLTLHAVSEWDYPCSDILLLKAGGKINRWAKEIGWESGVGAAEEAPALDEYDEEWADSHPGHQFQGGDVYAQLGGWPVSWPDESAAEQIRRKLVLRTYADSEPWLEVFKRGRAYEVIARIT